MDPNLIYKNIDKISEKLSKKGYNLNSQEFKTLYENRKDIIQKAEALKEEQNIFTKKISKEKRKPNSDELINIRKLIIYFFRNIFKVNDSYILIFSNFFF